MDIPHFKIDFFGAILGLQKNWADSNRVLISTPAPHYHYFRFPPLLTSCLSVVTDHILLIQSQLMDMWIVSTLGLSWIMVPWPSMYRFLCMLSVLLGIYLGMKLLNHMTTLCLTLWGIAKLYSQVAAPLYKPAAMYKGFNFSTSLPTVVIVYIFDYTHSSDCEVVFHCAFDLHFPGG